MTAQDTRPISDADGLRESVGEVHPIARDKVLDRLDRHARRFIELSPFLCLSTMSAEGTADVSPRGDPPGFVQVEDDHTLLIPDRPGNRRVDSMHNLLANPSVGLIFFVPGIAETLRVSGRGAIVRDAARLAAMAVSGKPPKLAIEVRVQRVFFHCAKALIRSRLWDPESRIERGEFPSFAEIIRDQQQPGSDTGALEEAVQADYRDSLY